MPDSLGTSGSDKSAWTVPILAEFMDARQKANEALITARYDADQLAIKNALISMDKRLEEIQHFRGAMQDQAANKVQRSEFLAEIRTINTHFEGRIDPIDKALTMMGRPNWPLFISAASVVIAILGGCWLLIGMEISVAISPMTLNIEQNKGEAIAVKSTLTGLQEQMRVVQQSEGTAGSTLSEIAADRARQTQRIMALETEFGTQRSRADTTEARFSEKLTEVETQFYGADQIRNLDIAHIQRLLSILWHRTAPGETLPTDNSYYPIARPATPMPPSGR